MAHLKSIELISKEDQKVIIECMTAALKGTFFWEDEFQTLMGVDRLELETVINNWPAVSNKDEVVHMSILGSIANLLGYPHRQSEKEWNKYISVDPAEVKQVLDRITT